MNFAAARTVQIIIIMMASHLIHYIFTSWTICSNWVVFLRL